MQALPLIETARLRLRPCSLSDVEALYRVWTDPAVRKYLWEDKVISREQAVAEVKSIITCFETHGFGQWVVMPKGEATVIGFCGLRFAGDTAQIELLYGLAPAYWRQGLITEAAKAMLRYGFEEQKLGRISANADTRNGASVRILEKVGMQFDRHECQGERELVYYVLSRDTFQADASPYRVHHPEQGEEAAPRQLPGLPHTRQQV